MAKIYTKIRTVTDTIKIKKGTVSEEGDKVIFMEDDTEYELPFSEIFKPFRGQDFSLTLMSKEEHDLED